MIKTFEFLINLINDFYYFFFGNRGGERWDGAQRTQYTYDGANRLRQIVQGEKITAYTYDGLGVRRTTKTTERGVLLRLEEQIPDPLSAFASVALLIDAIHQKTTRIVNDGELLGGSTEEEVWYYQTDLLGSVTSRVNASGKSLERIEYAEFGMIQSQEGTPVPGVEFEFTEYRWEAETGLYDAKTRAYHPGIGRFLQEDPNPGTPDPRVSRNRYAYCWISHFF